jgi:hypothetical protein
LVRKPKPLGVSLDEEAVDWKASVKGSPVAEIIQYVFGLGDIQRGLIYDAMRDCYLEAGFDSDSHATIEDDGLVRLHCPLGVAGRA